MTTENLFEQAVRLKIRFEHKGSLSAEDLWDLSLEDLNTLYGKLKKESRNTEDSLLVTRKTKADKELEIKLEVVKYVFDSKKEEAEEQKRRVEKKRKNEYINGLIQQKQNAAMQELTIEQLEALREEE